MKIVFSILSKEIADAVIAALPSLPESTLLRCRRSAEQPRKNGPWDIKGSSITPAGLCVGDGLPSLAAALAESLSGEDLTRFDASVFQALRAAETKPAPISDAKSDKPPQDPASASGPASGTKPPEVTIALGKPDIATLTTEISRLDKQDISDIGALLFSGKNVSAPKRLSIRYVISSGGTASVEVESTSEVGLIALVLPGIGNDGTRKLLKAVSDILFK